VSDKVAHVSLVHPSPFPQAKIERDQRYGAPPPVYRPPDRTGAIDVRKSVAGSRGSHKIREGDCLYRIAINNGREETGPDLLPPPPRH